MASIVTRKGKRGLLREIQFTFRGRQAIRLGYCSAKQAQIVRLHIEALVAQQTTGHPADAKTHAWLRSQPDKQHGRIARTGLCGPRGTSGLESWVDRCIKSKESTDAKATTTRRKQARRLMLEYFEPGRDLRTVTAGDAEDLEAYLHGRGLAEATVRKRLADVRQWFGAAVRHKLIEDNPFAGIRVAVPKSDAQAFVDATVAAKVMDKLPNARLRAVFALARWGGLRTPSEPAALRWRDVDWDAMRISVNDVKRSRVRVLPLFPELVAPLHEWYEQAPTGEMVFPGMSPNSSALVKPIKRAAELAGVTLWPRLLQNLRASRQTELEARHPRHVVCAWLGNSAAVAAKHYLMVRESDFESAVKSAAFSGDQPESTANKKPFKAPGRP